MKALVIGSSGFIGGFLTRALINAGYQVAGMDLRNPSARGNSFSFSRGSILKPDDIAKAAKGAEAIIHLAAEHHDFGVSEEEFFRVNVQGMQNILDCAGNFKIKKFIFYSTVAVYGNHKEFSTEETPADPLTAYAKSKLEAERLLGDWVAQDSSRQAIIIRPCVVFGPHNYANTYKLIHSIYKQRFIFVGKGDNIKSIAYVENLVNATIFLLEKIKPGIGIYNYTDYPQMTIKETVETISRYLPGRIPKFSIPLAPAMVVASIFDLLGKITGHNFPITAFRIKKFNTPTCFKADKIRKLGFKQKFSLSEGFRKMIEWYRNE